MTSYEDLSDVQKKQCERQISEDLIARSTPGAWIILALWGGVAWLIEGRSPDSDTVSWLLNYSLIFILGIGLRIILTYFARKNILNTFYCRLYIALGLVIGCLSWGVMAACSYLDTPLFVHQDLILFATIGLSAGGAVTFSASRFYTYVYVLCMLAPILFVELLFVEQITVDKVTIVSIYILGLLWVTLNPSREYMAAKVSNLQLLEVSNTDGLTGVRNRRYFDLQLEEELNRARRTKEPVALMILDLDHFKKVNDEYGHIIGDECLIAVARCLKNSAKRISDTVARYGGEEFALILANTNEADCLVLAERIRNAVEIIDINVNGSRVPLTISIGVSCCAVSTGGYDGVNLLTAADSALYLAKDEGRNRVCVDAL